VEEEYLQASFLYDKAIELDSTKSNYFLYRAANHLKLGNYVEAIPDCAACVKLNPKQHKAWNRQGMAYFHLEEFESSLFCFTKAKAGGSKCDSWIRKCKAELKHESTMSGFEPPSSYIDPTAPKKKAKVRISWCQSDKTVTITLFVKNLKKDHIKITLEGRELRAELKLPDGSMWKKAWYLYGEVDEKKFKKSMSAFKIEMVMPKSVRGEHWENLEDANHQVQEATDGSTGSKKTEEQGDALEKEMIDEEKLKEGDDWQKLFKHIYAKNDPATQSAMNKSYTESGGKKDYSEDIQAPDGAEAKKYVDIEN